MPCLVARGFQFCLGGNDFDECRHLQVVQKVQSLGENVISPALAVTDEIQVYTGDIMSEGNFGLTSATDKMAVKLMLMSDLIGPHGLFVH